MFGLLDSKSEKLTKKTHKISKEIWAKIDRSFFIYYNMSFIDVLHIGSECLSQ